MSGTEEILLSVEKHVATITLNRPQRGNSITGTMSSKLLEVLNTLEKNDDVRVVVITGSGKYFCTGMDLGAENQATLSSNLDQVAENAISFFNKLREFKKPTIAKINGPAMGGGWGLVFALDIRIASKNAFFWFSEVKRGIVPALISSIIVPQIGSFQALQFMLTGKKVPAIRAHELGFISEVVNDDELDNMTQKYVEELLENGPKAMQITKETVSYVSRHTPEESKKFVSNVFQNSVHSAEALYGMQCFLQKKKPNWSEFSSKL
eukprot:TRINITY_DN11065_c0_g1_i1.p1 TRINITY_DN11065_c0_g1~~TRINITY_DN11065_c0_g1_i1.p1  ORF type:complete len:265 (-),score=36.81 TRINITY_DN11065_c0_g1_i1:108-902(-)